ncbi:MAG TPA: hypothetical protein VFK89_12560, partial [Actinomycetota bacterium]|nr:hypothetical protein [Actinomycetota bacterium]
MRRFIALIVAPLLLAAPAGAATRALPEPPAGAISKNVTFVGNIPELKAAISINFIGDTMFVST